MSAFLTWISRLTPARRFTDQEREAVVAYLRFCWNMPTLDEMAIVQRTKEIMKFDTGAATPTVIKTGWVVPALSRLSDFMKDMTTRHSQYQAPAAAEAAHRRSQDYLDASHEWMEAIASHLGSAATGEKAIDKYDRSEVSALLSRKNRAETRMAGETRRLVKRFHVRREELPLPGRETLAGMPLDIADM